MTRVNLNFRFISKKNVHLYWDESLNTGVNAMIILINSWKSVRYHYIGSDKKTFSAYIIDPDKEILFA